MRRDEDALRELIDRTLTTTRPDGSSEAREIGDGELATTLESSSASRSARPRSRASPGNAA